jgi:hypothetical protein
MKKALKRILDALDYEELNELEEYVKLEENRRMRFTTTSGFEIREWIFEAYRSFLDKAMTWDHFWWCFRDHRRRKQMYWSNQVAKLIIDHYWLKAHPEVKDDD